ncbi:MMPL family transporter, partial [candidate division CSSED10-310 bacterium]
MVSKLLKYCARFPIIVVVLTLAITAYVYTIPRGNLINSAGQLIIDSSLKPFINKASHDYFLETRAVFGNEEFIVIALKPNPKTGFDLDFFLKIDTLTREITRRVPEVSKVLSLTTAPQTSGDCFGKTYFHVLGPDYTCSSILEKYQQELDCIREAALKGGTSFTEKPVLEGNSKPDCEPAILAKSETDLRNEYEAEIKQIFDKICQDALLVKDVISEDFQTTALIIQFTSAAQPHDQTTQEEIKSLISEIKEPGLSIAYASQSRQEYESALIIRSDIKRILPLTFLVMIFIFFLSFKSLRGVFIPVTIISVGIFWTFGFFALLGSTLNLVTLVLAPLLISVGSAYVIHLLAYYYHEARTGGRSKEQVIEQVIDHLSTPLVVTAITTIAGFGALMVSPIPAVKDLGLYACLGVALIILLSLTLAPALLSLLPLPKAKSATLRESLVDKILHIIAASLGPHAKSFIRFWILIGIFSFFGLLQVSIDSKTKNFPDDSPVIQELTFIENNFAGTNSLCLILHDRDSTGILQKANTIRALQELKKYLLDRSPGSDIQQVTGVRIDKLYSPVDWFEIKHEDLSTLKDRDVPRSFKRLKAAGGPTFLSFDKQQMQITIRMQVTGTTGFLKLRDLLDRKFAALLPEVGVNYTGSALLASESAHNISVGQIRSISLALLIIFVILSILFLSLKMGLIALYPNIVAIAVFFGVLGWFNIPIGVTISVIASIALGIGVDDTIHFLSGYNKKVNQVRNELLASQNTLVQAGKPMVFTTLALGLGFLILALSQMQSQAYFGVLTAFTLVVCLCTDLNFLPAITTRTKMITAWNYLELRYGKQYIQDIGLFGGMSVRETKLATLMAYTQELEADEILFQENDVGQELFVILEGSIDIYLSEEFHQERIHLLSLGKGKTFGEMGLFRQSKRTASARATEKTKLLVLDDHVFSSLMKRYPLIASRLFRNLASNLAGL